MTDSTKEIIAGMLKENTGTHFLDSGGSAGRHWQRNQVRDFDAEPRGNLRFYSGIGAGYSNHGKPYGGFDASMNLYHWLTDRVSFSEMMDTLFHEIYVPLAPEDDNWFELADGFRAFLGLRGPWKERGAEIKALMLSRPEWCELWGQDSWEWVDGVYSDDDVQITPGHNQQSWEVALPMGEKPDEWFVEYTYNCENYLDQDFQYYCFTWDSTEYILLMIHGGADARGGFTKPRAFETNNEGFDRFSECHVYCPNGHIWETVYDGYHFRPAEVDSMPEGAKQLDEYEIIDRETYEERLREQAEAHGREFEAPMRYVAQMEAGQQGFSNMEMPKVEEFVPELDGVIFHESDGRGYCPLCSGELKLDFFSE